MFHRIPVTILIMWCPEFLIPPFSSASASQAREAGEHVGSHVGTQQERFYASSEYLEQLRSAVVFSFPSQN